jgi:proteasome lid subunit RPN8/RPN11
MEPPLEPGLEPLIERPALAAMRRHALEAYPDESCGFVLACGSYRPVANRHPEPTLAFRIDPADYLAAPNARAVVHSHAVADAFDHLVHHAGMFPHCPSLADMTGQLAAELPWGVVVTDGQAAAEPFFWGAFVLERPLLGRPFRHGVEDCYTAIRKWYWQERRVCLPDYPRSPDWWYGEADMYLGLYAQTGFRRLGADEVPGLGDIGLARVGDRRVKTLNHGFVHLGDGTIYHHLPGRLSRREAAGGRLRQVTHWLRHVGTGR